MQNVRARYEIVGITDKTFKEKNIVFIEDVGHNYTMSVTNDAEAVVYELMNKYAFPLDIRIIYKDSDGQWDELLHDGDQFTGFKPYRKRNLP